MTFPAHYRTSTAVSLAEQIRGGRWELAKFLADALEDAGADGAALAPLRDTGIADSRSGLWLDGVLGKGGLWEWGLVWEELERMPPTKEYNRLCHEVEWKFLRPELKQGTRFVKTLERDGIGVLYWQGPNPDYERLRSRRAELQRHNTGGRGERWDECPCPEWKSEHYESCHLCGGPGDFLRQRGGTPRPISFDLGPLPVVTVRLEEVVREAECGACSAVDLPGEPDAMARLHRRLCPVCSGSGVVQVPSAWLRALPPEYDLTLEGAEPYHNGSGHVWYDLGRDRPNTDVPIAAELPTWLFDWVDSPSIVSNPRWKVFSSPAAAHAALRQGLRRWRYGGTA